MNRTRSGSDGDSDELRLERMGTRTTRITRMARMTRLGEEALVEEAGEGLAEVGGQAV
jgi:hypothetical protein